MADQRITQLTALPKAGVAATDVLPIADISASQTKKVTAKDLVDAGLDLIDVSSIDLDKLDQASTTKLGTTALADDAVTYAKLQNVSATDKLLGRSTAGAGNVEEIPLTAAGRALLDDADAATQRTTLGLGTLATQSGTYAGTHSGTSSGTNTGDQTIALTGDVTGSGTGSFAATISNDAVTYAKLQNTTTTDVVLGRSSAGAGNVEEIVCTAAGRALIDDADATAQRSTLGLGSIATQSAGAVAITGGTASVSSLITASATITGGTITGITDLAVADGGTGASDAANARANLGLSIGTNVQAQDAGLQSIAGLTTSADLAIYTTAADTYAVTSLTAYGRSLLDDADAATARTTLGLGSLATQSATVTGTHSGTSSGTNTGDQTITLTGAVTGTGTGSFATTFSAGAVNSAAISSAAVTYDKIQNVSATDRLLGRVSAGAGSVEEITCTAAGRALLDDADAATQRATLGLGTLATGNGTWTDGASFSGTSSGTNTGDQTITLTGAVTGTGTGSFATAIATSAVTENAIAANAVTTGKILDDAITAAKLDDDSAAIVAAASPSGTGAFIGQQWVNTNNGQEFTWTGSAWLQQAGIGTINIVDSTPIAIAVSYPDAYSATLTTTLDTQAAATVFAGPTSGANAAPTFRAIAPADLPDATASTKGIVQPGTGLAVTSGVLNHSNAVTGATVSSITFDAQGHITAAVPLVAADIPVLDASKITTGTFPTALIANESITGLKIANSANCQFGETLPVAEHTGQFFFNPLEGSIFLWDGNVWQPVGVTTGAIILAGTYNATLNQIVSTTLEGAAIGLTAGSPLPSSTDANANYYVVVSVGGTGTAPAPTSVLAPPDLILSTGSVWVELDVSGGAGAIAAVNVVFSAIGEITATNVQAAIEEVSTECRNATNIISGTLAVARGGTGLASYAKGDILGASAATTLTKLTVGTNGQVLRANSATATGLEWGNDFVGTVTTVTSSTGALTIATATTTPALTIRAATTSVDGIVQLSDSISTTSSVLAATPTAVKTAYDLAALALPKAGGIITGALEIGTTGSLVFEGATADGFETTLTVADPTADHTITLPNLTGTVALTSQLNDGTY